MESHYLRCVKWSAIGKCVATNFKAACVYSKGNNNLLAESFKPGARQAPDFFSADIGMLSLLLALS